MNTCGAYALIEINSGKCYIGSSGRVEYRLSQHVSDLRAGRHHCKPLQQLWFDGGRFETNIYRTATLEEARAQEQALISTFAAAEPTLLLNVGLGVNGGDNLTRNPDRDAIVEKISVGSRNHFAGLTVDEREVRAQAYRGENNGMYGKSHTAAAKERLSVLHTGNQYALNHTRTVEQRQRISEYASTRIGELNPFYGKSHNEATRAAISAKNKAAYEAGLLPPNSRKVVVNGTIFESLSAAAREIGISPALMVYRIRNISSKYAGYKYLD